MDEAMSLSSGKQRLFSANVCFETPTKAYLPVPFIVTKFFSCSNC